MAESDILIDGTHTLDPAWLNELDPAIAMKRLDEVLDRATDIVRSISERHEKSPESVGFDDVVAPLERVVHDFTFVFTAIQFLYDAYGDPYEAAAGEAMERQTLFTRLLTVDPDLLRSLERLRNDSGNLSGPRADVLEHHLSRLRRNGSALSPEDRARTAEIDDALTGLGLEYTRAMRAATEAAAVTVPAVALAELTARDGGATRAALAEAGALRADSGDAVIAMSAISVPPVVARIPDKDLRRRVVTASLRRGESTDLVRIVRETARLRAERAALLGYASFADWACEPESIPDPGFLHDLLRRLGSSAGRSCSALEDDATEPDGSLDADDWPLAAGVRPDGPLPDCREYFEFRSVLEKGVFYAATLLYGVRFQRAENVVGWHPDLLIYDATDESGTPLGRFYLDPFGRTHKRGGAKTAALICGNVLTDDPTHVLSSFVYTRPADGEPLLLRPAEIVTLFHECGHAIHALVARHAYPSLAGMNVPRDFIELPSLVNETWAWWPPVLANYAHDHVTGEGLPRPLLRRLSQAANGPGPVDTLSHLKAVAVDQYWHSAAARTAPESVADAEEQAMAMFGLGVPAIPPRYRSAYFPHVFCGEYAARYYAYMWCDIMAASLREHLLADPGRVVSRSREFLKFFMEPGGSVQVVDGFQKMVGAAPSEAALATSRGLRRE